MTATLAHGGANEPIAAPHLSSDFARIMDDLPDERFIDRRCVAAGAILGALAVLLGALGAHGLDARLSGQAMHWWHTAAEYQMWHALAVLTIGFRGAKWAGSAAWLLAAGAVLFSGTLYALALGAPHWLGAVTPIGGLMMIAGWTLLAVRASVRSR